VAVRGPRAYKRASPALDLLQLQGVSGPRAWQDATEITPCRPKIRMKAFTGSANVEPLTCLMICMPHFVDAWHVVGDGQSQHRRGHRGAHPATESRGSSPRR